MLPRPHRLPPPAVKDVMRSKKRFSADGLMLTISPNNLSVCRFAVVVPMSVDKRATARNRMRRLVRESLRLSLPAIAPGWDGVFFVRKTLPDDFHAVDTIVKELLHRAIS